MTKYEEKVKQFHEVMNLPVNSPFNVELLKLRKKLILEETQELIAELDDAIEQLQTDSRTVLRPTFENMCKEMSDVQYALSGLAVSFGLPIEEAFDATHDSNMSKLGNDGKPVYREDGKITKGPNYHKPDLSHLTQDTRK